MSQTSSMGREKFGILPYRGYNPLMKQTLLLSACLSFFALSCASNPQDASYREEKNAPSFGNTRSFVEPPQDVKLAAKIVLDELTKKSEPQASGAIKEKGDTVETGWVYSTSKNRYVEFKFNGKPSRKPLRIRRTYSYTVTPNLSGTQVLLEVKEEVMKIEFDTGKESGWSSVKEDPAAFEMLSRLLQEKIRSL